MRIDPRLAIILIILFALSLGYNIYFYLEESYDFPDTGYVEPTLADDKDARAIQPCIINYDDAGKITSTDSCWGDVMEGGTISLGTIWRMIEAHPDSVNCISYSFAVDHSASGSKSLFLILHGNHMKPTPPGSTEPCIITKVTGQSYASDMLCPTICPMWP